MPVKLMKDGDEITVKDSELVAGGDPETSYTIRLLTRGVRERIIEENTTRVPNPRTRAMDKVVDAQKVSWDLVDYALTKWAGILWDGEPAPCERDYKLKLDEIRLSALLEKAGLSEVVAVEAARGETFRGPGKVRRVVGQ